MTEKEKLADFKRKFLSQLVKGDCRVIDATTHPFALSEDIDLCTRCGVSMPEDDSRLWTAVAYMDDENGSKARVRPLIISECDDCVQVEGRDLDASFEFASA